MSGFFRVKLTLYVITPAMPAVFVSAHTSNPLRDCLKIRQQLGDEPPIKLRSDPGQ
jgi:hypothetical protein